MEDQVSISHLKQGDLNGLENLVNRYQAKAVHAAYLVVYDQAAAEDIAQTAFLSVAKNIHQFDETRPFAPWFFRIVLNEALKVVKAQKRNISLEEQIDEPTAKLANWLTDPNLQPEQVLEQKEIRENILGAIQNLPPDQRAVIVMRYFLDMTEADMSAKVKRPLSTIKWWLRDARKRLHQLLEE